MKWWNLKAYTQRTRYRVLSILWVTLGVLYLINGYVNSPPDVPILKFIIGATMLGCGGGFFGLGCAQQDVEEE